MLIAITTGEPAGIGPDIILKLAQKDLPACPVAIGDRDMLAARAKQLGVSVTLSDFNHQRPKKHVPGKLLVNHFGLSAECSPGVLNASNAQYVLDIIQYSVTACLKNDYAAVVTGPIQKSIINESGLSFSGHTEYIGKLTGSRAVMMLCNDHFRVALLTTHLPLEKVSRQITKENLKHTISILHNDLQIKFGINKPKILVAGLNPHAGENGHLGKQEQEIIEPVIQNFIDQGMSIIGPLPADTLFTPQYLEDSDVVLTMYHDQGLPTLKYAGFGRAVNITLGLPIIRTSVDHGTALNLSGTGKASESSLAAAFQMAYELSCSATTSNMQT